MNTVMDTSTKQIVVGKYQALLMLRKSMLGFLAAFQDIPCMEKRNPMCNVMNSMW